MENRILIDLSIKFGLDDSQVSKVVNALAQVDVGLDSPEKFQELSNYICQNNLVEVSMEELVQDLQRYMEKN